MGAPNKHVMQFVAYDPNALIDHALAALNLSSDAKLAEITGTNPPIISKYRNRRLTIGDTFLVNLSELLNTPTKELKRIAGMTGGELRDSRKLVPATVETKLGEGYPQFFHSTKL